MAREIFASEIYDKNVCEALDCLEVATEWISVQAGPHGPICLHLCKECTAKFERGENA